MPGEPSQQEGVSIIDGLLEIQKARTQQFEIAVNHAFDTGEDGMTPSEKTFTKLLRWPLATDANMRYVIEILIDQEKRLDALESPRRVNKIQNYTAELFNVLSMAERILDLPREATPQEMEMIRSALRGEGHGQKTSEDNGSAADQKGTDKSARE